jgi:hypothetical protein
MKISVYDTYVQRDDDSRMHFDILVPSENHDRELILEYGRTYLRAKGVSPLNLKAEKCNYCHVENANSAIEVEIAEMGFAIIELENCH